MDTLDLHGVKHADVSKKVEDFVLLSNIPCRVVTGNSVTMKSLVQEVLAKHQMKCEPENDYNLGSLIVTEK